MLIRGRFITLIATISLLVLSVMTGHLCDGAANATSGAGNGTASGSGSATSSSGGSGGAATTAGPGGSDASTLTYSLLTGSLSLILACLM